MFKKPKNIRNKVGIRRRRPENNYNNDSDDDDDDDEDDKETSIELNEARKRAKTSLTAGLKSTTTTTTTEDTSKTPNNNAGVLQAFESTGTGPMSQKEMATRTNEYHPTKTVDRGNKFLAGPIKAPTNIRTTCRFDYQPDICKDYKDTGFCGFGDTCIYLHDRGDTLSGWQLEQKWQQEQEEKKKKQQAQMDAFLDGKSHEHDESKTVSDDGLPFACFLSRKAFEDPVVTSCGHYFSEKYILKHVKEVSSLCPVCNKDTFGVFNQPTKLINKKRKLCGRNATWEEFKEACQKGSTKEGSDDTV